MRKKYAIDNGDTVLWETVILCSNKIRSRYIKGNGSLFYCDTRTREPGGYQRRMSIELCRKLDRR